jgi:putative (di)nucleoside polyphosphate hydrolase
MRVREGVGAFVVDKKGNFLLLKRKAENDFIYWDIMRGGIEKGEKPLEALKRELKEELAVDKFEKIKKLNLRISWELPDRLKEITGYDKQRIELFFVSLSDEIKKVNEKGLLEFRFFSKKKFLETATFDTTKKVFGKMIKKVKV